jgi:hypothetical protein
VSAHHPISECPTGVRIRIVLLNIESNEPHNWKVWGQTLQQAHKDQFTEFRSLCESVLLQNTRSATKHEVSNRPTKSKNRIQVRSVMLAPSYLSLFQPWQCFARTDFLHTLSGESCQFYPIMNVRLGRTGTGPRGDRR